MERKIRVLAPDVRRGGPDRKNRDFIRPAAPDKSAAATRIKVKDPPDKSSAATRIKVIENRIIPNGGGLLYLRHAPAEAGAGAVAGSARR